MKKRRIIIFFLVLTMLSCGVCGLSAEQQALAQKLIRLHVVAASDSAEDQAIKLCVRDAVLTRAQELLADADDPQNALALGLDSLAEAAGQALADAGKCGTVQVRLGKELFPTREYATFALPAGVYESLRVTIGEGEGRNWWCVVFPSLCFTAAADDLELAARTGGFSNRELDLITGSSRGYVLKFRILELLQALKSGLFGYR